MTKIDTSRLENILRSLMCAALVLLGLSCSTGTETADNGGMSGTGLSQGPIDSFGSIFVSGVEWQIDGAQIDVDDASGFETDLRVGMVVRVRGGRDASGLSGTATSVRYDDELEGPIEDDPMLVTPGGSEKSFTILGRTVIVDEVGTIFAEGASFASIARNDVLEVSGFVDGNGDTRATRIEQVGAFPTVDAVELRGAVANLTQNGNGTGLFEIGSVTIEYNQMTTFSGFQEVDLVEGAIVEARGRLVGGGTDRIDAEVLELEGEDLAGEDVESFELEGIVSAFVSLADFEVAGFSVDASGASIEPMGAMIANGERVEVEGRLVVGDLVAQRVEVEDESLENVQIRAAISDIDGVARSVTMLGVEISIDGRTQLEDERDDKRDFGFEDLQIGDWLDLEAISTGPGTARAKQLERRNADADVRLEGPVTQLDRLMPTLSVLGQPIPLDPTPGYFDALGQARTETQFFDNPGDVQLGDVVRVTDVGALQSDALLEADLVEIRN